MAGESILLAIIRGYATHWLSSWSMKLFNAKYWLHGALPPSSYLFVVWCLNTFETHLILSYKIWVILFVPFKLVRVGVQFKIHFTLHVKIVIPDSVTLVPIIYPFVTLDMNLMQITMLSHCRFVQNYTTFYPQQIYLCDLSCHYTNWLTN